MMKMRYIAIALVLLGLSSCQRENLTKRNLLSDYEVQSYGEMFEVFWKGINTNYVYWAQDPLNWDSIYTVYRPRFDSVDKVNAKDGITAQNMAFQYLVDMTKDLKDGNYLLQINDGGDFTFADSLYRAMIGFSPKLMMTQRTNPVLPDTLFDYIIHNNYLNGFDYGQYWNASFSQVCQTITGTLSRGTKNIPYLGINNFMLRAAYYDEGYAARPIRPVLKNFFSAIRQPGCDGFIVDLRNNRGGNLEDIDFLVGQLTTTPLLFGYMRYKSGSGRLDYTSPIAMNVTPPTRSATEFPRRRSLSLPTPTPPH